MASVIVIVIYILSFAMSYAVGANDAANALATSYGSGAAPLMLLLILGAFFEFFGAFFCSGTVAAKLATRMIPTINDVTPKPEIQDQIMFSVSLASFLFIISSSVFGMPISGTHTVVGALIGAGIAGLGASAISADYMKRVVISWFVSPAVSSTLCAILISLVSLTTLNGGGASLKWRLFNLQVISGFTFAIMLYMLLILVQKNYTSADEPIIDTW
jgi:phosphate/sulfate permease